MVRRPYRRRPQTGPRSDFINRVPIIHVAPEHYPRLREIGLDPRRFPLDYDEFRKLGEDQERHWKRLGYFVIRVEFDPQRFAAFCAAAGREENADALMAFVEKEIGR